jgi:oxygen-independent coproporphyrinogen-3 oxidase
MVDAICREIGLQGAFLATKQLSTIYFGGGTPSLLSEAELAQILETIHQQFEVLPHAEISLEANPDDLNAQQIDLFLRQGINRLSIGTQSFNDSHLGHLNRVHNSQQASYSIQLAQDKGLNNLSIDLIYGISLPQTDAIQIWAHDLAKATALNVPHISAYCLTIEPQTVFGNWLKKKKIAPINDDTAAQHFDMLLAHLNLHGYEQYEISNFSKPDWHSRHNSSYWQHEAYLGVGPSAHSFDGLATRQFNVANNQKYLQQIGQGLVPCQKDHLSNQDQANEYLMIALRTKWGCSLDKINNLASLDFELIYQKSIAQFIAFDWLEIRDRHLLLTQKGKLFADKISSDLFL